jgi:hypothetical protein
MKTEAILTDGLRVVVGMTILFLGLLFAVWFAVGFPSWRIEHALRDPKVFEPVAKTLALYCQSDRSLFPEILHSEWLPEELNRVGGNGWAMIGRTGARIEMGGGFYHFGYYLIHDDKMSTAQNNVWQLSLYRDDHPLEDLFSVTVPVERKLSPEMLPSSIKR